MRNALLCLLSIPAIALAQNSAGIDLINFAPSDTQILAGGNVASAKNSPFGQFVLSHMQLGGSQFQKFISETGFDPRTDLTEGLIASTGIPKSSTRMLVAAHGSFSLAMATVEGALVNDGATINHLPGVDVIQLPSATGDHAPPPNCIAFFTDGATALAGDCSIVEAGAQSKGAAPSAPPALVAKAEQWKKQDDVWFTSIVPLTQFLGGMPKIGPLSGIANTDVFKAIQQTTGGVKFTISTAQGPGIQISGEAVMDSAQNATSLLNVINFLESMIKMAQPGGPGIGIGSIVTVLSTLQASAAGNVVSVNLTIPETTLEQFFNAPPLAHAAAW